MGCFFCCFKAGDDHRPQINHVSQPITAIPKEPVDSLASNSLWTVLVSEVDDSDHLQREAGEYDVTESLVSDDGLRAEAKFLKACGTLPQTPIEIRKKEKSQDCRSHNEDKEATLHSWLLNTEEALEKQPDQLQSPIKLIEGKENGSDYSSHSSNSLKDLRPHNGDTESTIYSWISYTPTELEKQPDQLQSPIKFLDGSDSSDSCGVANTQFKNKSVRFEAQIDTCPNSVSSIRSSSKITNTNLKSFVSPLDHNLSKPSPYPTPLKLTDDMQTPGTVYPSYVYNKETGKNQRIRSQHVYTGINPENLFHLKAPIEEDISFEECLVKPWSQVNLPESKTEKELNVGATLSLLLPPKSNREGCIDQCLVSISQDLPDFGQTPGVRPINGIPNTTTKYKEDQKVSWHATPFEQRLEKALLEDEHIIKSKQVETLGIKI